MNSWFHNNKSLSTTMRLNTSFPKYTIIDLVEAAPNVCIGAASTKSIMVYFGKLVFNLIVVLKNRPRLSLCDLVAQSAE